jgi:hypothetical protein
MEHWAQLEDAAVLQLGDAAVLQLAGSTAAADGLFLPMQPQVLGGMCLLNAEALQAIVGTRMHV